MYIETLFEARLWILLDAKLRLGLQCIFALINLCIVSWPACRQWEVGVVRALGTSPVTGIYHQRTELIFLSHI